MSEVDIKLLWGRSASLCSICRCPLVRTKEETADGYPIGEQAHIIAEKDSGPRGASDLSPEERDGYSNRILLCPNDHTMIDKDVQSFPVERLHQIKDSHEFWVAGRLNADRNLWDEADDLIYSDLIDEAVRSCRLDIWTRWTSMALEPLWRWPEAIYDAVEPFRHKVFKTDWPDKLPDLNLALDRLSYELMEAAVLFGSKMDPPEEGVFRVVRHYKRYLQEPQEYMKMDEEFWKWAEDLEKRIVNATAAANWMREIWRAEVNPMFFAVDGVFTLEHWMDETQRTHFSAPTFTDVEKQDIRDAGLTARDIPRRSVEA